MWTRSQEWTELISGMTNTHNSLSLTDSTEWLRPWEQPAHWPLAPGLLGRPYAPPASLCQPMSWRYPSDTRAPIPGQQWPLHPLPPTKSKRSVKRTMGLNCFLQNLVPFVAVFVVCLILRSYHMKIHLYKVDAAPRDSHPGRQHLFVGIVTFKGGKQGGVDVQQVPSPLLHKLPCSDKQPQFIHTT